MAGREVAEVVAAMEAARIPCGVLPDDGRGARGTRTSTHVRCWSGWTWRSRASERGAGERGAGQAVPRARARSATAPRAPGSTTTSAIAASSGNSGERIEALRSAGFI